MGLLATGVSERKENVFLARVVLVLIRQVEAACKGHDVSCAYELLCMPCCVQEQGLRCSRYWSCPVCDNKFHHARDFLQHVEVAHEEVAVQVGKSLKPSIWKLLLASRFDLCMWFNALMKVRGNDCKSWVIHVELAHEQLCRGWGNFQSYTHF